MINKLRIITIILFCLCVQTLLAQNVEFKASNFKTDKEETFFRLQYSEVLSFKPKWDVEAELLAVIKSLQRL